MKIKKAELETVCGVSSPLPENDMPEAAFAGKSNVGKSSLLNALVNRKNLARTSASPGKTQTINFYNVNDELYIVDLPGYGYTKANVKVKEQWGRMVERYLTSSAMLKAVFLLVDIRHEPNKNDVMMYDWVVQNGYEPIIIATKKDKIKKSQLDKNIKAIRNTLGLGSESKVIPFSSVTKEGREEIWDLIKSVTLACSE